MTILGVKTIFVSKSFFKFKSGCHCLYLSLPLVAVFPDCKVIHLLHKTSMACSFYSIFYGMRHEKHSGEPVGRGQTAPVRQQWYTSLRSSFRDEYLHLFVWSAHVEALVRTQRVVCLHGTVHSPGEFHEAEPFRIEQPSVLHRVVHALGKCVVQRVARLRHAYLYAFGLKYLHVFVTAVL